MAEQETTAQLADEARLKRELIQLEAEELNLEETREASAHRKAERGQKARKVQMSQATLATARVNARNLSAACKHRQGGESGQIYKGKGPTALKVEKMPDGFTVRIRCLNCPLRITSPFPPDGSKKLKRGETTEDRAARLAKFNEDKARFQKFYETSQEDALTSEAAQPMEPGTTFKFTDEDGTQIFKPRPSDRYAMEIEMNAA
jgi:hypothetical protein